MLSYPQSPEDSADERTHPPEMSSPSSTKMIENRIRVVHLDRFLRERLEEEQILSLTYAQFRSVLDAAAPRWGEEITSLDFEPWVQRMMVNPKLMGPEAPPPTRTVNAEEPPKEYKSCCKHWITRGMCILSNHTAACCVQAKTEAGVPSQMNEFKSKDEKKIEKELKKLKIDPEMGYKKGA